MPQYEISFAGAGRIGAMLRRLKNPDFTNLQPIVSRIIEEGNARGLDSGVDRFNKPFAPLRPSTLADPRRGPGPPLNPAGSRFRKDFVVTHDREGPHWYWFGMWPTLFDKKGRYFGGFHITGTGHRAGRFGPSRGMPARDYCGIRPQDMQLISRAVVAEAQAILAGQRL